MGLYRVYCFNSSRDARAYSGTSLRYFGKNSSAEKYLNRLSDCFKGMFALFALP